MLTSNLASLTFMDIEPWSHSHLCQMPRRRQNHLLYECKPEDLEVSLCLNWQNWVSEEKNLTVILMPVGAMDASQADLLGCEGKMSSHYFTNDPAVSVRNQRSPVNSDRQLVQLTFSSFSDSTSFFFLPFTLYLFPFFLSFLSDLRQNLTM